MTRVGIGVRAFGLAAALGLAASGTSLPHVAGSFLLLCAIAAVASVPQSTATAQQVVPIIEGALVGLALAVDGSVAQPLMLYLVVPVLIAGLAGGPVVIAITLFAEMATMASVQIVRLQSSLLPTTLRLALPWLLTAVGIGLLGSWIRRLRADPGDDDRASYVAAHRLLDELRRVSRRLSSGLDPAVLSVTLLDDCLSRVIDGRGAVLVRTDGSVFVTLAQRLDEGQVDVEHDPVVLQCWMTAETVQQAAMNANLKAGSLQPRVGDEGGERTRWALPMRIGTRMVGVFVLDIGHPLEAALLMQLRTILDERALPLETALLFDEVRTLATVEERHRLAREIHDGIAQEIASLGYLVDDIADAPDTVRVARVGQLRGELTRIVDDLRLSIFDLRSQVSRASGLGSVLGDYLSEVGLRSGTAVHLTLDETPDRLRLEVEEQLLRIVQEAVTNARKHAGAANLWVTCRVRPPAAHVVVEDDGSGLQSTGRSEGFGMSIMRERAHRIGASLDLSERADGGTRVSVRLNVSADSSPLADDEPPDRSGRSGTRRTYRRRWQPMAKTVLLIDDHELIRHGLRLAFERSDDFEVAGEAGSVGAGLRLARQHSPDVVVVDMRLPDGTGLDATRALRELFPDVGIVILTMYAGDDHLFAALDAGASAFVAKNAASGDVVAAARHACASPHSFTTKDLASAMRRRLTPRGPQLSDRERQVLELLADGLGVAAISRILFVSDSTTKSHIARLYEKLGAANRAQAIMNAVRSGLLARDTDAEPPSNQAS